MQFIKINYDGVEIGRETVCDFYNESPGQTEYPYAISYDNGYIYLVFYAYIHEDYHDYNLYQDGSGDYLGKFDLDGDIEWIKRVDNCEGQCLNNYDFFH